MSGNQDYATSSMLVRSPSHHSASIGEHETVTDASSVSRSVKSDFQYQRHYGYGTRSRTSMSIGTESRDDFVSVFSVRPSDSESRDTALSAPKEMTMPQQAFSVWAKNEPPASNLFKESTTKLNIVKTAPMNGKPLDKNVDEEGSVRTSVSHARSVTIAPLPPRRSGSEASSNQLSTTQNGMSSGGSVKSLPNALSVKSFAAVPRSKTNGSRMTGFFSMDTQLASNVKKGNETTDEKKNSSEAENSDPEENLSQSSSKENAPSVKSSNSKPLSVSQKVENAPMQEKSVRSYHMPTLPENDNISSPPASRKTNDTTIDPPTNAAVMSTSGEKNVTSNASVQSNSITSKKMGYKVFLKLKSSNTNVSSVTSVTGWGNNAGEEENEKGGIDPSNGSFDLVLEPKKSRQSSEGKMSSRSKSKQSEKSKASSTVQSSLGDETADDDLEYWTGLSVRAAMAVIQAKGSQKVAQKAANTVLEASKKKPKAGKSKQQFLRVLASKASVAVLEAGGNHTAAAAVAAAIMSGDSNNTGGEDSVAAAPTPTKSTKQESKPTPSKSTKQESKPDKVKTPRSKTRQKTSSEDIDAEESVQYDRYGTERDDDQSESVAKSRSCVRPYPFKESEGSALHSSYNEKHVLMEHDSSIIRNGTNQSNPSIGKLRQSGSGVSIENHQVQPVMQATNDVRKNSFEDIDGKSCSLSDKYNVGTDEQISNSWTRSRGSGSFSVAKSSHSNNSRQPSIAQNSYSMKSYPSKESASYQANHSVGGGQMATGRDINDRTVGTSEHLLVDDKHPENRRQPPKERFGEHDMRVDRSSVEPRSDVNDAHESMPTENPSQTQYIAPSKSGQSLRMSKTGRSTGAASNRDINSVSTPMSVKTKLLAEKERQIQQQNMRLEEAARLNMQKEQELDQRMAELDAATAALLERANHVRQEIDKRAAISQAGNAAQWNNGYQEHQQNGDSSYASYGGLSNGNISYKETKFQSNASKQSESQTKSKQSDLPDRSKESNQTVAPSEDYEKPKGALEQFSDQIFRMFDFNFACVNSNGGRSGSDDVSFATRVHLDNQNPNNMPQTTTENQVENFESSNMEELPKLVAPSISGLTEDFHTNSSIQMQHQTNGVTADNQFNDYSGNQHSNKDHETSKNQKQNVLFPVEEDSAGDIALEDEGSILRPMKGPAPIHDYNADSTNPNDSTQEALQKSLSEAMNQLSSNKVTFQTEEGKLSNSNTPKQSRLRKLGNSLKKLFVGKKSGRKAISSDKKETSASKTRPKPVFKGSKNLPRNPYMSTSLQPQPRNNMNTPKHEKKKLNVSRSMPNVMSPGRQKRRQSKPGGPNQKKSMSLSFRGGNSESKQQKKKSGSPTKKKSFFSSSNKKKAAQTKPDEEKPKARGTIMMWDNDGRPMAEC